MSHSRLRIHGDLTALPLQVVLLLPPQPNLADVQAGLHCQADQRHGRYEAQEHDLGRQTPVRHRLPEGDEVGTPLVAVRPTAVLVVGHAASSSSSSSSAAATARPQPVVQSLRYRGGAAVGGGVAGGGLEGVRVPHSTLDGVPGANVS